MKTTIITCDGREEQYDKTFAQVTAMGLTPIPLRSACQPPSVEDNLWKAYRAAQHAAEDEDGLLFLEDDVDFNEHFPRFLNAAVDKGVLTTFILFRESLYPGPSYSNPSRDKPNVGHLVPLNRAAVKARRGFHGSQAIYLPPHGVERLLGASERFVQADGSPLEAGSEKRHGFDFWVKDNAHLLGGLFCAWPNPVQHREEAPSTFNGKVTNFRSRTYGAPTYFPGG